MFARIPENTNRPRTIEMRWRAWEIEDWNWPNPCRTRPHDQRQRTAGRIRAWTLWSTRVECVCGECSSSWRAGTRISRCWRENHSRVGSRRPSQEQTEPRWDRAWRSRRMPRCSRSRLRPCSRVRTRPRPRRRLENVCPRWHAIEIDWPVSKCSWERFLK